MKISDAKKLADRLDIPLCDLLDASIRLMQDVGHGDAEGIREAAQLDYPDVAFAI